jgi:hypothetical protein
MIWLGSNRGHLTDWVTQKWVQICGRKVDLVKAPWLDGPIGDSKLIGKDFFHRLAAQDGLQMRASEHARGLLRSIESFDGPSCDSSKIQDNVADFYERTSSYTLDAWGEWSGMFRPFGRLLAVLFSRRPQQLNVPLSALDTSQGMSRSVSGIEDFARNRPSIPALRWISPR